METLDIVKLIEKNSLTRLSKDYENKLLNKIKTNFTDNQQQLFVASFYCFLNYDSKKDFIIDFDNVWKWLGFTRKDNAKRLLEKNLVIDIDYIVQKAAPPKGGAAFDTNSTQKNLGGAGINKENIMLTINTFKKFCLKAGTKKADEVHDYYIKLEELVQETVNEESNELRKQLNNSEEEKVKIEEEKNKAILLLKEETVKRKILKAKYECFLPRRIDIDNKFEKGNCIYIVGYKEIKNQYKIGFTEDLRKRLSDYHTDTPYTPIVHYKKYYIEHKMVESVLHHVLRKFRIYNCKEWFYSEDLQNLIDEAESVINFFEEKDKKYKDVIDIKEQLLQDYILKEQIDTEDIKIEDIKTYDTKTEDTKTEDTNTEDTNTEDTNTEDIEIIEEELVEEPKKTCYKCKENLTFDNFAKNPAKKNGFDTYCKNCNKERYTQNKNKKKVELEEKKCTKCDTIKNISEFYNRVGSSDGKTSECKDCTIDMYNNRVNNRQEFTEVESKTCLQCKETLDISNFSNKKDSIDGHMSWCKTCCSTHAKTKRAEPKENVSDTKKCNTCSEELSIECFWNSKSTKDGKDNKCKECHKKTRSSKKK
jgi:hypothetical protein